MKKVKILDVAFDVVTFEEAILRVRSALLNQKSIYHVVTPNPEMLLEAQHNFEFKKTLNHAQLSIPDGIGILWASTFQKSALNNGTFIRSIKALLTLLSLIFYPPLCKKIFPERISGVDMMVALAHISQQQGVRIFLLGGEPGIAEKTQKVLEKKFPGIQIVGTYSGSPKDHEFGQIQTLLQRTSPDILFVAYGAPQQELWIRRHAKELATVKVAMGVGGAFDFLAGKRKRAPRVLRFFGLEWLYRLAQEPSRFRRIYNATIRFPLSVIARSTAAKK